MRQISILPAGVQVYPSASLHVLHATAERIYYASTLAIYIYDAKTFNLEKVVSVNDRTITSFCVSPHDANLMVIAGLDGKIMLWNIRDEEIVTRISTTVNNRMVLAWDRFVANRCAIITSDPCIKIFYWDVTRAEAAGITELFAVSARSMSGGGGSPSKKSAGGADVSVKAVVGRWNPHVAGLLAVGCDNGHVLMFDCDKRVTKAPLFVQDRTQGVVDLQWDRLSSIYVLVAYSSFISLWDAESGSEIHVFDKQGAGITSIAWLDWTAGNFVSTNSKTGTLRVWNASQRQPLETVRIAQTDSGINCAVFGPGTQKALCACSDGSVSVYHIPKKQLEFKTFAGHTETIFDCAFSPVSPDVFATASYDGTIKLWNLSNLSLEKTLYGAAEIIYGCDWSPDGRMIGACTSSGLVLLWDVETGREMARLLHHVKHSYRMSWNKLVSNLICTSSADCSVVVFEIDFEAIYDPHNTKVALGSRTKKSAGAAYATPTANASAKEKLTDSVIHMRYVHPAPVFGASWCPFVSNILVTGCQDGDVRVLDYSRAQNPLLALLKGHVARTFNCEWSPLVPGLLATGSDDQKIILWNVNLEDVQREAAEEADVVSSALDEPPVGAPPAAAKKSWFSMFSSPRKSKSGPQDTKKDSTSGLAKLFYIPSRILSGHTSNVRALSWNSEHKELLLSGSWDSTIRLWNVKTCRCLRVITDHVADVYAIVSHPDRPFTYVSSSRDTTLRVWELDGLFSSLRTQAIWDLSMEKVRKSSGVAEAQSRAKSEVEDQGGGKETEEEDEAASNQQLSSSQETNDSFEPFLSGRKSAALGRALGPPITPSYMNGRGSSTPLELAKKFYLLFNFFSGANGSLDVWECVLSLLLNNANSEAGEEKGGEGKNGGAVGAANGGALPLNSSLLLRPAAQRIILPENEILAKAQSDARKCESVKMGTRRGEMSEKTAESLRQAAVLYARVGDFVKYCSIMIELGEWTKALALAPSVSMEYWRSLSLRYSEHLSAQSAEECVPYLVAIGHEVEAVNFYLGRGDVSSAMVVAKMSSEGVSATATRESGLEQQPRSLSTGGGINRSQSANAAHGESLSKWAASGENGNSGSSASHRQKHSSGYGSSEATSRSLVRSVVAMTAEKLVLSARPIHAAAQHLSIGDATSAVTVLTACGEYDLAYAVSIVFGYDVTSLLFLMSNQLCYAGNPSLALEVLGGLPDAETEQSLVICLESPSEDAAKQTMSSLGLRSPAAWLKKGTEEEVFGNDATAVVAFIIGRSFAKAVTIGLAALKKVVRDPLEMPAPARRVFHALKHVPFKELDEPLTINLFMHLLWFGAHEAMEEGLWETGYIMLQKLQGLAEAHSFLIPPDDLRFQALFFLVISGDKNALVLLQEVEERSQHVPAIVDGVRALSLLLREAAAPLDTLGPGTFFASKLGSDPSVGVWGPNTHAIRREMQRLGDALSLPSLTKLHTRRAGNGSFCVVQGSMLPAANFRQKTFVSCISGKRIQGATFFGKNEALPTLAQGIASSNEMLGWLRINKQRPPAFNLGAMGRNNPA